MANKYYVRHAGVRRTCTEIPVVILAFNSCATRRGIGEKDRDALFGSGTKKASFLSAE